MADAFNTPALLPVNDDVERTARQIPTSSVTLPYTKTLGAQAVKLYKLIGKQIQDW